jgi:hypothetical protein
MKQEEQPNTAEPTWISAAARVPEDGQSVLAKGRYDSPRRVTFRRHPTPRWDERNMSYQFERFDHWAELPARSRGA